MLGQMTRTISIVTETVTKDSDGFPTTTDTTIASNVRAYREGRQGSEAWRNRAAFTDATDLYRFRVIHGTDITTKMIILDGSCRMQITSVEYIRGRGLYVEVLTKEVVPSGTSRN